MTSYGNQLQVESNLLTAMISGSAAAIGVTAFTYPFEYYKTALQLHRYLGKTTPSILNSNSNIILGQVFRGCGTTALGNSLKASTRFLVYNWATKFMSNSNGKTTAPRIVIAGAISGFAESIWIIPFENIKTTLIENTLLLTNRRTSADLLSVGKPSLPTKVHPDYEYIIENGNDNKKKPGFSSASKVPAGARQTAKGLYNNVPSESMINAIKEIYSIKGIRGFWQGSGITLVRQMMSTGVWFSVYNSLRQIVNPHNKPNAYISFFLGAASSVSVIAVTQPLDVIKTRLQSKNGKELYRDTMTCGFRICYEEGFMTLWKGWVPRLVKVSVTGGLTLALYQNVSAAVNLAIRENPFAAE